MDIFYLGLKLKVNLSESDWKLKCNVISVLFLLKDLKIEKLKKN